MRGHFIAIEGIDGAGISTQARALGDRMRPSGREVVVTREPTDHALGRLIRQVLRGDLAIPPASLALLFAADRIDHLDREILPALDRGAAVIAERYVLSSLAYQGHLLGDRPWVRAINRHAIERRLPDLTIVLDVAPLTALARIDTDPVRRGRELFERDEALGPIRSEFRRVAIAERRRGQRVELVRADDPIDAIHDRIWRLVASLPGMTIAGIAPSSAGQGRSGEARVSDEAEVDDRGEE